MSLRRLFKPDIIAVLVLVGLWMLFFWRLFTPIEADQASLEKGDFSGQFVAFGAYQYQRLAAGEVPLWNPYNNGGLPFIADTQAAVFYPPRLITIGLSKLAGGWSYHALELEMTVHVLVYSLLLYLLVRRITIGSSGSISGAFAASVIGSYGGFLTSYPPLQLALLEAAVWLPLGLLGIYEATRPEKPLWGWLIITGGALGLSWMAGHPQTSWFSTFLLIAYFGYQVYQKRYRWTWFVGGTILFGAISGGMAAVQLLPGVEYLSLTSRTDFGFDAKGNGFPFRDVIQFLFPGIMTLWSPLFVGVAGLMLALTAAIRRAPQSLFWIGVALVGLGLSFGANSPIYALFYNTLPGMRYFRGQERAAFLVANSLAIVAGIGIAYLGNQKSEEEHNKRNVWRVLAGISAMTAGATAAVFYAWLGNRDGLDNVLNVVLFSTITGIIAFVFIGRIINEPLSPIYRWLLAGLIVFELFTINMDTDSNYDPLPPSQQVSMTAPPLVAEVLADSDTPFRVDGYRGVHDNFGSLYSVADIRGISPLFLNSTHSIIQADLINPLAWELFAVRYVFSDWETLPVPSVVVDNGSDRYGAVNLHQLSDPRPFVLMVYDVRPVTSDEEARSIMSTGGFDARQTVLLNTEPNIGNDQNTIVTTEANVTTFRPEQIIIEVDSSIDGILSISNPDYPGWRATVDGEPAEIMRAYGALQAVVIRAGQHTVELIYDPLSYRVGAAISLVTWSGLTILWLIYTVVKVQHARNKHAAKLG